MPQFDVYLTSTKKREIYESIDAPTYAAVERELFDTYGGEVEIHSITKEEEGQ